MLILDRKAGRSVMIKTSSGEIIRVTVIANNEFGVKLGFDAKRNIKIDTEERWDDEQSNHIVR